MGGMPPSGFSASGRLRFPVACAHMSIYRIQRISLSLRFVLSNFEDPDLSLLFSAPSGHFKAACRPLFVCCGEAIVGPMAYNGLHGPNMARACNLQRGGGGGYGMKPWYFVVCCWRHQSAVATAHRFPFGGPTAPTAICSSHLQFVAFDVDFRPV